MRKSAKNIYELVIKNVINLGFLLADILSNDKEHINLKKYTIFLLTLI